MDESRVSHRTQDARKESMMPPKDRPPRSKGQGSRRALLGMTLATGLALGAAVPAAAGPAERADVWEQGGAMVLAEDGARLVRQPNGLHVSLRMPAPEAGTYVYPAGTTPGSPEVFTLWMFVFNHPENCTGPCGPDDSTNPAVEFGVYNPAGHVNAGGWLTLSGRVGVGDEAQAPPGVQPYPLVNPDGAEVHLAVTSHGELDPATLPNEFRIPTGSPLCGCWWIAKF